jgi:hypothetical protein
MIKVQISAIRVGDRVAKTRTQEFREVTATEEHPMRIRLTFADDTTAQPAKSTVWWLDAEASAAEGIVPTAEEGRAADLAMGADPTGTLPSRRKHPAKRNASLDNAISAYNDRVTFFDAAEQVLRAADGPMKVSAVVELALPLVNPAPKAKKPDVYLTANMHVDAKNGGRFVKTAPGTFDVRAINPKGAAKRPAANAA